MSGQPSSKEIVVSVGVVVAAAGLAYFVYRRQTSGLESSLGVVGEDTENLDNSANQSTKDPKFTESGQQRASNLDSQQVGNDDNDENNSSQNRSERESETEGKSGFVTQSGNGTKFKKDEWPEVCDTHDEKDDLDFDKRKEAETVVPLDDSVHSENAQSYERNHSKPLHFNNSPPVTDGFLVSNVVNKNDSEQSVFNKDNILIHADDLKHKSLTETGSEKAAPLQITSKGVLDVDDRSGIESPLSTGPEVIYQRESQNDDPEKTNLSITGEKPKLAIDPKGDNKQQFIYDAEPCQEGASHKRYFRDSCSSYSSQQSLEMDSAPLTPHRKSQEMPPGFFTSIAEDSNETFDDQLSQTYPYPSIISRREEYSTTYTQSESLISTHVEEMTQEGTLSDSANGRQLESGTFHDIHTHNSQNKSYIMHPHSSNKEECNLPEPKQICADKIINSSKNNIQTAIMPSRPGNLEYSSGQAEGQTVAMASGGSTDMSSNTSDYGSLISGTDNMSNSNFATPEGQMDNLNRLTSVPQPDSEPYPTSSKSEENNETISDLEAEGDVFDGVILHAEADREKAIEFMDNMKGQFPDLNLNLTIYEEFNIGKSLFGSAPVLFKSTRYLFVFITDNFVKEEMIKFLNEIFLIATITEKEKFNRLIPVAKDEVYLPELGPIISLKYNRFLEAKSRNRTDQVFIRGFQRLICEGRNKYLTAS